MIYPPSHYVPEPEPTDNDAPETEADRVVAWRRTVLERAGFDVLAADLLASSDASLHRLLVARENGITDEMALRVFL